VNTFSESTSFTETFDLYPLSGQEELKKTVEVRNLEVEVGHRW
jgi:hypothetical protein